MTMENFNVGVVGGVCGISQYQYDRVYADIKMYLKTASTVTVTFWHDPRNRTDGMWSDMGAMCAKLGPKVKANPLEFPQFTKDYMTCPHIVPAAMVCDVIYLLPAATGARSRVKAVEQLLSKIRHRLRTVRPWLNETHDDAVKPR